MRAGNNGTRGTIFFALNNRAYVSLFISGAVEKFKRTSNLKNPGSDLAWDLPLLENTKIWCGFDAS